MGCTKKTITKEVSTERCNEMIKGFENQIQEHLGVKEKYKGNQRKELIQEIKDNPSHIWEVTIDGLIHYEF
jgi:hypothetical protein